MLFMSSVICQAKTKKKCELFPSELLYGDEKVSDEKKKRVSIMEHPEERTYDPTDS